MPMSENTITLHTRARYIRPGDLLLDYNFVVAGVTSLTWQGVRLSGWKPRALMYGGADIHPTTYVIGNPDEYVDIERWKGKDE